MEEETINQDNLSDDTSDDVGSGSQPAGLKEVLERELGKKFSDEQSALKAVKDTFNYVGKAGKYQKAVESVMQSKGLSEDDAISFIANTSKAQSQEVDMSKYATREELQERDFYSEKPDLKPYQATINAFRKANPDKTLSEVIELPEVKGILDKAIAQDTVAKQKSVLHSNQKIGIASDKMTKAREASQQGNVAEATKNAVGAVIDAFEI